MNPISFKKTALYLAFALPLFAACSGNVQVVGNDGADGGDSGNSNPQDGGAGPESGGGCSGAAPACFGLISGTNCCVNDPIGNATCHNGAWACPMGTVPVNQCGACSDSGSCGPPPPGPMCPCGGGLQCINGQWTCSGGVCDGGGPPDSSLIDANDGGSGPVVCGQTTCNTGEICVKEHDSGGACLPVPDSGVCPPNHVNIGGCCAYDQTTYTCQPMPPACNGSLACGCASQLCACQCMDAVGSELDCVCNFP
jgi:hypothetical protein